ncbi:IS21-like element helper ATPase IstB [Salibacterium qingdaonense]|uniref:DNA replication protein DnaC n=1 Tax=Salibacterium qingdaonense TaxID=266892 RepID=A0A1I4NSQ2_9BACI|nr:IS21-like element helper ATPase IstB [Salibacterium qingdaonense]SFM18554.1 DNA replication protein DnaC [Salibacterium qingdaonense]
MNQQNINKLKTLKLSGMAEAYETLLLRKENREMDFDTLLGILIDHEESQRKNNKLHRLLKQAGFPEEASIEDILYYEDRKLDEHLLLRLAAGNYLLDGRNVILKGVSGSGKTWIATALGVQACRQFFQVQYTRLPDLLESFKVAKYQQNDSYVKLMKKLLKVDLLILDEWLLHALTNEEAALLLEIINARRQAKQSTIFCSQFDIDGWYEKLGDGTLAEAILDRIVHDSYDIFIDGKISMRERFGVQQEKEQEENNALF